MTFKKDDLVRGLSGRAGVVLEVLHGDMKGYYKVKITEGEHEGRVWPFVGPALTLLQEQGEESHG